MQSRDNLADQFQAKFNDYKLQKLIGSGGMGEVWEATQTNLDRKVAIKILSKDLANDPKFIARFNQEARALAKLNHPHIVTIYDARSGSEFCFIAMEYVVGNDNAPSDLKDLIQDRKLDSSETRRLLIQILNALNEAHEKGIVHRDIKPSNVMLNKNGDAKVGDFGIASLDTNDKERDLTRTSIAMGTSHYMAPEQAKDARSVDRRADLFSCGVLLYEMLTGELPLGSFPGASTVVPGLNREWDGIIEKAMQPNPEKRYATAAEMLAAIEAIQPNNILIPNTPPVATNEDQFSTQSVGDDNCFSCRATVGDEDTCPECGIALRFECPRCDAVTIGGAKSCSECGLDIYKTSKFKQYIEQAKNCFVLCEDSQADLTERFKQAEQATLLIARALKFDPDSDTGLRLQKSATDACEALAFTAGKQAMDAKKYSLARQYFETLKDNKEKYPDASQRLATIEKSYQTEIASAQNEWKSGEHNKAISRLRTLESYFENDSRILEMLAEYDSRLKQSHAVAEQLNQLFAADRLFEFKRVWNQANNDSIILPDMTKAIKQIESVEQSLETAEQDFVNKDFESCISQVNKILEYAVDCEEAKTLKAKSLRQIGIQKLLKNGRKKARYAGIAFAGLAALFLIWIFRDAILGSGSGGAAQNSNTPSATTTNNPSTPGSGPNNPTSVQPSTSGNTTGANRSGPPTKQLINNARRHIKNADYVSAQLEINKLKSSAPNSPELPKLKSELADARTAGEIEKLFDEKRFVDARNKIDQLGSSTLATKYRNTLSRKLSEHSNDIETADTSSDSRPAGDHNDSGNEPIAEFRSPKESATTLETKKPVVDVEAFGDAALNGKIETVRRAIEAKVDVNATDDQRRTALMLASFNGHTPVVQLLLKEGATVDYRDASGRTALMFAATGTNAETVELLLDAGADVNALDSGKGFTALMHAAAEGQEKVVQVLLKHNANRAIRDTDGDTARDFAAQNGHAEVVRLLSK